MVVESVGDLPKNLRHDATRDRNLGDRNLGEDAMEEDEAGGISDDEDDLHSPCEACWRVHLIWLILKGRKLKRTSRLTRTTRRRRSCTSCGGSCCTHKSTAVSFLKAFRIQLARSCCTRTLSPPGVETLRAQHSWKQDAPIPPNEALGIGQSYSRSDADPSGAKLL